MQTGENSAASTKPADPLRGLAILLLLQAAGEVLARGFGLPFPGPVVGMLLLLPALSIPFIREPVARSADFLLQHLSLLFVPVGVGVLSHLELVASYGGRMLIAIVLSTWAGIVVTAWVYLRICAARGQDPEEPTGTTEAADPRDAS